MEFSAGGRRRRSAGLRLIDGDFIACFSKDNVEGTNLLVRTILGKPDLKVAEVTTQEDLKNLQGRSVRLDMLARDGAGRLYNIEVQRKDEGAGIKRASLHSALLCREPASRATTLSTIRRSTSSSSRRTTS